MNVESGPENHFATPLRMALEKKKKKAAKKLQELKALEKASASLTTRFPREVPGGNHQEVVAEQVEFRSEPMVKGNRLSLLRLRKKTLR